MILNAEQERESNRVKKLVKYLLENKDEYEARKPFNDVVQLLLGNAKRIAPLIPEKGTKGASATEEKKELKSSLAIDVNELCTNVTVYARSTGDKALQYAVRYRTSDIINAKDGDVLGIVNIITAAITPLLSEPTFTAYEITAETLAALTEKATGFDNSIGAADIIDTASSIANGDINEVFKTIRGNVSDLNLLVTWFDKKNPAFAEGYRTNAAINKSGIRHNGIEGVITNSLTGAPVEGATITGEGKNKIAYTDKYGVYKLIKLQTKDMKITITAPGYDPQGMDIKILRGKIIERNVTLQGKVITLSATA